MTLLIGLEQWSSTLFQEVYLPAGLYLQPKSYTPVLVNQELKSMIRSHLSHTQKKEMMGKFSCLLLHHINKYFNLSKLFILNYHKYIVEQTESFHSSHLKVHQHGAVTQHQIQRWCEHVYPVEGDPNHCLHRTSLISFNLNYRLWWSKSGLNVISLSLISYQTTCMTDSRLWLWQQTM